MYKEDLKRIASGAKNWRYLLKGWFKTLLGHEPTEEERKKLSTCGDCDSAKDDTWFDTDLREHSGVMCGECFCPIIELVISDKKCPLEKW